MQINREELAWAAGFFDGEGWVGVSNNYKDRCYLRLAIGQTQLQPLQRFQKAIGGLGRLGRSVNTSCKHGSWWKVNVSSFEHVQAVGAMLWPFLCEPKRVQFAEALSKARFGSTHRDSRRSRVAWASRWVERP